MAKIITPEERKQALDRLRSLKMARSAHAYVRGKTDKFYRWLARSAVAEDKADGYSAFGNFNFNKVWSVFGRYDWIKPTKVSNNNLKDKYYNVGIQWEPVKIVDLAPVYKCDSVDNGLFGTQNGTIGGANPAGTLSGGHGTYSEIGLFGQLRF